jgi:hypothetical protein
MWFPSFNAWWTALKLSVPMFGLGRAAGLFGFWIYLVIGVGLVASDPANFLLASITPAALLVLSSVCCHIHIAVKASLDETAAMVISCPSFSSASL